MTPSIIFFIVSVLTMTVFWVIVYFRDYSKESLTLQTSDERIRSAGKKTLELAKLSQHKANQKLKEWHPKVIEASNKVSDIALKKSKNLWHSAVGSRVNGKRGSASLHLRNISDYKKEE